MTEWLNWTELISFRIDWLDLLAVQGTLKTLLQHHSSKASILWHSAFFSVQISHPYMTTGKTKPLTRWTFVGRLISLLLNMLSRLVITFLLRSRYLLNSWRQSPCAVILEPTKIKSLTVYIVSPSICHEVMGPDAMILVFWMLIFFFFFTFISWRLIILQYCSGFCHTLTWISHGFTCVAHLELPSHLPWMLSFKQSFSLSSFTFIKCLFSSSSLFAIRVVSSAYLSLLIFLPAILIPGCASSSLSFHLMYSAYKLNNQGENIQPWHMPFSIWNQSVVSCPVLTVTIWSAYRFLRK